MSGGMAGKELCFPREALLGVFNSLPIPTRMCFLLM